MTAHGVKIACSAPYHSTISTQQMRIFMTTSQVIEWACSWACLTKWWFHLNQLDVEHVKRVLRETRVVLDDDMAALGTQHYSRGTLGRRQDKASAGSGDAGRGFTITWFLVGLDVSGTSMQHGSSLQAGRIPWPHVRFHGDDHGRSDPEDDFKVSCTYFRLDFGGGACRSRIWLWIPPQNFWILPDRDFMEGPVF